jgi:hypothetical protein
MIQGESKDTHFFVYFTMLLPYVFKRNQTSKLKKAFFSLRFEGLKKIQTSKFGKKSLGGSLRKKRSIMDLALS